VTEVVYAGLRLEVKDKARIMSLNEFYDRRKKKF